ncbi:hypothetical protein [Parasegetibacter sp. NRK P23]|uniref:hypothetical protein n=1 Tax=Parasegetibacter sp. NRK P23 TaxID=2942999 RepID=UPI002044698C|nr:hypothetical protein [Parasegetibacter sp. NRK P23]MCM5530507.1 hypothetical protein [Parasegetibacter sp. NRK P23]
MIVIGVIGRKVFFFNGKAKATIRLQSVQPLKLMLIEWFFAILLLTEVIGTQWPPRSLFPFSVNW